MTDLGSRAVVVTGAGRGLGRAYAENLAAAGARVVVNDIDPASVHEVVAAIRGVGGVAVGCVASVTEQEGAAEIVQAAVDSFGGLHALVNNAGVLVEAPAWETGTASVRAMVEVNVVGSILVGHAAIRQMLHQGDGGSIVNVTSGTHLGQPGLAVYGATKGAVASLTYGWALDLRDSGIWVNAISPLAVTPMKLPPYDGHVTPGEVADAVQFLVSDASLGITGQVLRRARSEIGLLRHPAIGPMLSREQWRVEDIKVAFEDSLWAQMEPVGFGDHRHDPRQSTSVTRTT